MDGDQFRIYLVIPIVGATNNKNVMNFYFKNMFCIAF